MVPAPKRVDSVEVHNKTGEPCLLPWRQLLGHTQLQAGPGPLPVHPF